MKLVATAIGATMIGGGVAKLAHPPVYEEMVEALDWTETERQHLGTAELVGGLLMLFGPTRRLGAGVVLAASGAALAFELRASQVQLAGPRAAIIAGALAVAALG